MLLQAFVESGKAGAEFLPRGATGVQLGVGEAVRVRDRATIVARHIYGARGDAYADAQVCASSLAQLHSRGTSRAEIKQTAVPLLAGFRCDVARM